MQRQTKYSGDEIVGQKFGRYTILENLGVFNKSRRVLAKCDCGNIRNVLLYTLTKGNSQSCGCLHKEIIGAILSKHTTTHGLSDHPLYGIWCNIKRRCNIEGSEVYYLYGAKGVKVCKEWTDDFKAFYDWCMANGWEQGLEVDKDLKSVEKPGKLYSPETCAIVTPLVNVRNRNSTEFITYDGVTLSIQEWAEKLNLPYTIVWQRIKRAGWSLERMIKEPGLVEHSNFITYNGETLRITEWSRRYNVSVNTISKRMKNGWEIGRALETPINQKCISNKNKAA